MEISVISDTITSIATKHALSFANFLHDRQDVTFSSSDHQHQQQKPSATGTLQMPAVILPIDAVAPPVKSRHIRTAPKRLSRKRCRTKRKSKTGGGPDDGVDGGGLFGGDGPFGGGGGGGGGGNYDGFGGFNWDEESSAYPYDPAFDFIYEVLCWIVFSNCLHFAFKKVVRIWADGIADRGREKVPMKFVPII